MQPILEALWPVALLAFWLSVAIVGYVYAGYPVVLWLCARIFGKRQEPAAAAGPLPFISIVIAAHNEEDVIGERMENLLALDYPHDRLEVIIASDGSTDRTNEIVRRFVSDRVHLLDFARNRGKAAVLNDALAAARGEILILSDANTMMDAAAARLMAQWFSDPGVGVVCGRLVLVDPATGRNVDGMYWKYETFLKQSEARLGALLGANGAIYAIRRSLFPRLSARIAVDDFVIPLLARLNSGSRIVYESRALAFEETPAEISSEFSRRSRIGAGGFQSLSLLWPLVNPLQGWVSFAFVSHKILRWVCPFFLVGAAASSIVLAADPVYRVALLAQVALYLLAVAGHFSRRGGPVFRLVRLTTMFAAMNLALMAGFFQWASGRRTGVWQRTARTSSV